MQGTWQLPWTRDVHRAGADTYLSTSPAREQAGSGHPTPTAVLRDFIVVDDSGNFSFHRSEQDLIQAFEYVDEARCIIDREGSNFRLALDGNRELRLGRSFGPVEFHWLRQAWREAQRIRVQEHPLLRFYPTDRTELIAGLFEVLELEDKTGPTPGPWTVVLDDTETRPGSLGDLNRQLSDLVRLDSVVVQDPFGHRYRPVRHLGHRYLPRFAGFICYVEIPPRGRKLPPPDTRIPVTTAKAGRTQ